MKRRPLIWQVFSSFLLLSVISLFVIVLIAASQFRSFYFDSSAEDLNARANLLKYRILPLLEEKNYEELRKQSFEMGQSANARLTVILPDGLVVCDSQQDPKVMDNHSNRPDVQKAFTGEIGVSNRNSITIDQDLLYVAIPVMKDAKPIAVIRMALPMDNINKALWGIYAQLAAGGFLLALLIAFVSLWLSRKITKPIEEIRHSAEKMASGDFSHRLRFRLTASLELQHLATSMNQMAKNLSRRIATILQQKNEQAALFASMGEGVLAVDKEERIKFLNPSAAEILNLYLPAKGKSIQEVIRIPEILDYIQSSLRGDSADSTEIHLQGDPYKILHFRFSKLRNEKGKASGVVIVFTDITKLVELENHRKDFVANVSHELRTPLTSIQGFAETLMNPAIQSADEMRKYIAVILRHAERLAGIIEDLLALSRLEKENAAGEIVFQTTPLNNCVSLALEVCSPKAAKKSIQIDYQFDEEIEMKMNSSLMEQALVNLIDNAIKYSDENTAVGVRARRINGEVEILIQDQGIGIPEKHVRRLFERFYRVDKGRSREVGGTGLGLAIVKHVANAHKGRVHVESEVGKGSRFYLYLPHNA